MKIISMYPDKTDRAQLVCFFPVKGNQRDSSPSCCASGGKEFSGTGRFPLSEQVRLCTSSHIDAQLVQKACSHHHLDVHIIATVWRREQWKETQRFTTASSITSQSLLNYCSKRRQPCTQVAFLSVLNSVLHPVWPYQTIPSSITPPTVNSAGETALDAARRLQQTQCVDLVRWFS